MEAVKESLQEMHQLFTKRMEEFTEELNKTPTKSTNIVSEFSEFKAFVLTALQALQNQIELLDQKTDHLDMRSRRKILLFYGLPEVQKECIEDVVLSVVTNQLKLTGFSSKDISRCHRVGKTSSSQKPRPILVKFRDLSVRSKVWFAKTQLKGSGITVSEFLTKSRHELFAAARQKFGVTKCWTRDGYIYILDSKGERRRVNCVAELHKIETQTTKKPASAPSSKEAHKARRTQKK